MDINGLHYTSFPCDWLGKCMLAAINILAIKSSDFFKLAHLI